MGLLYLLPLVGLLCVMLSEHPIYWYCGCKIYFYRRGVDFFALLVVAHRMLTIIYRRFGTGCLFGFQRSRGLAVEDGTDSLFPNFGNQLSTIAA
jgi:hypothetical protein